MANSHQIISIFVWAVALSASWHQIEAIGQVTISPEAINNKLTAIIDEQYVMTCTSSGNDEDKPKALQWRTSRGTLFTDDKFQRIYTQLMGDSLLLFFSRVTKEDSTVYLCSYMQDGQQKELGVELVLRKRITFLDTPATQSIRAGNIDQLVVCKTEAIPGPEISWMRNDLSLRNDAKYQITNDGLRIKNVQAEDEGIYTCQAMVLSTGEAKKLDINVQVITQPKWVKEPQDVEGTRGQELIIKCDAFAKPAPLIKFLRGDIVLAGNRFIQQGNLMTIRQLENSDSGTYTCAAENEAGTIVANFRINVLIGPVLKPIDSIIVSENEKATLRCDVLEAFPPPTFQWKYTQTQQFLDNVPGKFTITNKDLSSEIRFEDIKSSDRGNYTCVATNKAAITEISTIVNVKYAPIFRINELARDRYYSWLRKDDMGVSIGSAVVLTCIVDSYPPASIKWLFKAQTLVDGPKYRLLPTSQEGVSQIEVNPKDITDFGAYTCQADNSVSKNTRDIPLLEATVPRSAPMVDKDQVKSTLVGFRIQAPSGGESDGGMPIESFQVQWRLAGLDWTKPSNKDVVLPLGGAQEGVFVEIDNLAPDTEYVFRVAAVNRPGVGAWSPDIAIRTLPRRQPDPVRILNREECGSMVKCMIEWVPQGDGGSPIIDYFVVWKRMSFKDPEATQFEKYLDENKKIVQAGISKFEIGNLQPGSYYHVTVRARNVLDYSAFSEIKVKTQNSGIASETYVRPKLSNFVLGLIISISCVAVFILAVSIDMICYFGFKSGILWNLKKCCKTETKPKPRDYQAVPTNTK